MNNFVNEVKKVETPGGWLECGIAFLTPEGVIKGINPEFCMWLAVEPDEVEGEIFNNVLSEKLGRFLTPLPDVSKIHSNYHESICSYEFKDKKGWLELIYAREGDTWFVNARSVLPDLNNISDELMDYFLQKDSDYREIFIRMVKAEARLNNLLNHWPGVIFTQRADFTISFVSPKIEDLTGISPDLWNVRGDCFWNIIHEGDIESVKKNLMRTWECEEGVISSFRIRNVKTGKVHYIHEHRQAVKTVQGMLMGYEVVWLDITRQTIAEKRLSTASWKEALGILTMGLAHDFSNLMSGIHGLSESFSAHLEQTHPFREGLELIKRSSLQASQIVHRIINLHHGKVGEKSYQDLNQLLESIIELVKKIVPKRIKLEVELCEEQLPIYVDPIELQQVIINMTLNAVDAIGGEGRITFRTGLLNSEPGYDYLVGSFSRYPLVCVWIEDTGIGIKKDQMKMIFDPFYTTKPINKGSGLGLYNAKIFAEKHHAAITIKSEFGKGSSFGICFPKTNFMEIDTEITRRHFKRYNLLLISKNERILESTAEFLRLRGFVVATCNLPERIRETIENQDVKFNGVVLVFNSPQELNMEFIERVRSECPNMKIVIQISGGNTDEYGKELLTMADMVIYPEEPEDGIVEKLNKLLTD